MTPFEVKDYLGEARERYTEQFKDKDVFDRYVRLALETKGAIQEVLKDLIQRRSIDTATGKQLDLIGQIVGQERFLIAGQYDDGVFAFDEYTSGETFGTLRDEHEGGAFVSLSDEPRGLAMMNDATYRLFIKAKIQKNIMVSTPEEFLAMLQFILGATNIVLREESAKIRVFIGRKLNEYERAVLTHVEFKGYEERLIPKTVGVGLEFMDALPTGFFAFAGVPDALGFGDLVDAGTGEVAGGGQFAEIF